MEALGLAAAEDVVAPIALPSFDNSAMDGYAVRRDDVADARREDAPVHLPVVGEIGAGQAQLLALSPGTAAKIMTGAPMPDGRRRRRALRVDRPRRRPGPDRLPARAGPARPARRARTSSEGDLLLEDGTVLGPRHLGLLASVGRATVRSRPAAARGRDLDRLRAARARDAARATTRSTTATPSCSPPPRARAGAIAYRVGIVPDEPRAFLDALQRPAGPRRPGGHQRRGVAWATTTSSRRRWRRCGTVWFGAVAMQPGKPQGFGVVGEDDTPIFTLPGNPVSSYVSFEMFVLPALRTTDGQAARTPGRHVRARLTHGVVARPRGGGSSCAASYEIGRGGPTVSPVGGARLPPGRRPGRRQRADRRARGRHRPAGRRDGAGAGARRGVLMASRPDRLTHVDETGAARMVDVSGKDVTARTAIATGRVLVRRAVVELLRGEGVPKGDALAVARVAGIMGAKQTPSLDPAVPPAVDLRRHGRPHRRRRRGRDHRHRPHHRPHRRRDGGADRRLGRRAHRRRHGQGGRQGAP